MKTIKVHKISIELSKEEKDALETVRSLIVKLEESLYDLERDTKAVFTDNRYYSGDKFEMRLTDTIDIIDNITMLESFESVGKEEV